MRRRSKAGGEPAKSQRHKAVTPKRRSAPESVDQETELARRTRERDEALEQQRATAEVLKIISASPTELQPVLEAVVRSAARYCEADDVTLFDLDGQDPREAAHWGSAPHLEGLRFPCTRGSVAGRVILERKPVHVVDLQAEVEDFPEGSAMARRFGHRTIASVPLLREGVAVGTLQLRRTEVNPFTDKQIALLGTFADQAVIAIENTRLLNELRQRTGDLSESLEQQTATSGVLKVIGTSPTDANPVFEAILESACRLCDSQLAAIFRFDGTLLHLAATKNWPAEAIKAVASRWPMPPDPHMTSGQVVLTKGVVIQEDTLADANYDRGAARAGGWRRMLGVPMLRGDGVIGVIVVTWREPGPIPQKQVELLQTFAAQAVIAIENARLFNELRESLEQQTATADVLRVISSSSGDLEPVFQAMLANATASATPGLPQ